MLLRKERPSSSPVLTNKDFPALSNFQASVNLHKTTMLKHDVVVEEEERIDTSQADSISVQATNIERLVGEDHSVSEALVRRMDSIKEGGAVEEVIEKDQHSLGIQETQQSKKNCGSDELIIRKKMKKIMSP